MRTRIHARIWLTVTFLASLAGWISFLLVKNERDAVPRDTFATFAMLLLVESPANKDNVEPQNSSANRPLNRLCFLPNYVPDLYRPLVLWLVRLSFVRNCIKNFHAIVLVLRVKLTKRALPTVVSDIETRFFPLPSANINLKSSFRGRLGNERFVASTVSRVQLPCTFLVPKIQAPVQTRIPPWPFRSPFERF